MLVGHGVVGHHVLRGAQRQRLVGGVAGVEAVAAVGVDRQPGHRRIERVAQQRAVIDIAVVGGDRAGDGAVFKAAVGVGHRHWRIVGAGQRDGDDLRGAVGAEHREAVGQRRAAGVEPLHRQVVVVQRVGPHAGSCHAVGAVAAGRACGHHREDVVRAVQVISVQIAGSGRGAWRAVGDPAGFDDRSRYRAANHRRQIVHGDVAAGWRLHRDLQRLHHLHRQPGATGERENEITRSAVGHFALRVHLDPLEKLHIELQLHAHRRVGPLSLRQLETEGVNPRPACVDVSRTAVLCQRVDQRIGTRTTVEAVAAGAAVDDVVAGARVDDVAAGTTVNRVDTRSTSKNVVTFSCDIRHVALHLACIALLMKNLSYQTFNLPRVS